MKINTPKTKIKISLNLDSEALRRLDKLCATKNLSRPQVIEMLFSTDNETVTFMTEQIKKLNSAIGF